MVYREKRSVSLLGYPLLPNVIHRGSRNLIVNQGNHSIRGFRNKLKLKSDIEFLHFPIRSYQQFLNKIVKGGEAVKNNKNLKPTISANWRTLYAKYEENKHLKDYFASNYYHIAQVEDQLVSGEIIEDRRLEKYLKALMQ